MKRAISALVLTGMLLGAAAVSGTAYAGEKKPAPKAAAASYECPKCHAKSDKAGNCAKCKVAMVKAEHKKAEHKKAEHKKGDEGKKDK